MKIERLWGKSLALALPLMLACGCQSASNHPAKEAEEAEGPEVKMKLDQVPPAVRDTLTREAAGATIGDVDKEQKHDKTVYETDVMLGGKNYELKVAEDGSLISKKLDNEEGEKKGEEKDEKEEKGEKGAPQ